MTFDLNGRKKTFIISGLFIAVFIAAMYLYHTYNRTHIRTDDAYIEGTVYTVSPRVPGTVKTVYVTDNQAVKKGDPLVDLDPVDYEVKVTEAQCSLDVEKTRLTEDTAKIEAAKASLAIQEANLNQAQLDLNRAEDLFKKESISQERHEKAQTAFVVATSQVSAARQELNKAISSLALQESVVKLKEAMLETAKLSLNYTKICAPADGRVTKKTVEPGNLVQEGQPLIAIVDDKDIWVIANYKETQLRGVKPGQRAVIRIDMYPHLKLNGRVDSVMAATGAVFSLFPAENATGNYVKIVQRVPVKIVIDKESLERAPALRLGLSVVPTIVIDD